MNRSLPCGDCHRGSAATGRPHGPGGTVPGAGGLVCGIAADPAALPQNGLMKTYREGKTAATIELMAAPEIATSTPQLAHVRAWLAGWQYWTTAGKRAQNEEKPAAAGAGRAETREIFALLGGGDNCARRPRV